MMSGDESNGPEAAPVAGLKRPVVMPDIYNGEDEWRDWLFQFESCAELNGWDDTTKCKFVFVRLKGTAGKALGDLDQDTRTDWKKLKDELTSRFDATTRPDLYKSEFMGRRKKDSETYLELGNAIRSLARKAYPSLTSKVRDELAKDKFLRALDKTELALRVRHTNPKSLDEAIRMTLEWEAVERDVRGKNENSEKLVAAAASDDYGACASVAQKSDKSDQLIDLMTEMLKEMREDRQFRSKPRQDQRGRGTEDTRYRGSGGTEARCWTCNNVGHISRNCPQKPGKKCYNCGKTGHFSRSCPDFRRGGN